MIELEATTYIVLGSILNKLQDHVQYHHRIAFKDFLVLF